MTHTDDHADDAAQAAPKQEPFWIRHRPRNGGLRIGLGVVAVVAAVMAAGALGGWWDAPEAAETTITVGTGGKEVFTPASLTIAQGDTVTFQWQGPNHNVVGVGSEAFESPTQDSGTFTQTFAKAGTTTFVCVYHPGMVGKITVNAAGAPAGAAAPAPAAGAPAAGAEPGAAPLGGASQSSTAPAPAPKLTRVRVSGSRLRFTLNTPATVTVKAHGTGSGRARTVVSEAGKAGANTVGVAFHRVPAGRYRLTVRAADDQGRTALVPRVRVVVTPALRRQALRLSIPTDPQPPTTETTPPEAQAQAPAATEPPSTAPVDGLTQFRLTCGGCHTLAAAGTTGTKGPNLDDKHPDVDDVVEQVNEGDPPDMPSFRGKLSDEQIQKVAEFVAESVGRLR